MGIFSFFSWKPSKLDLEEEMDSRSHFRIITINKNKEYLTEWVGLDEVIMFSFTISERYSLKVHHPCNHYHRWLKPPELRPDLLTGLLTKILGRKDHKNAKKSFIIVLTLERHSFYQKKRKTVRNVLTKLFLLHVSKKDDIFDYH